MLNLSLLNSKFFAEFLLFLRKLVGEKIDFKIKFMQISKLYDFAIQSPDISEYIFPIFAIYVFLFGKKLHAFVLIDFKSGRHNLLYYWLQFLFAILVQSQNNVDFIFENTNENNIKHILFVF
ncbi:hypothetical protein MXB_4632 [Myxobolus squamalis]|nr:hypothetical protein MXB_4632 [Myxobolus squamalis]